MGPVERMVRRLRRRTHLLAECAEDAAIDAGEEGVDALTEGAIGWETEDADGDGIELARRDGGSGEGIDAAGSISFDPTSFFTSGLGTGVTQFAIGETMCATSTTEPTSASIRSGRLGRILGRNLGHRKYEATPTAMMIRTSNGCWS